MKRWTRKTHVVTGVILAVSACGHDSGSPRQVAKDSAIAPPAAVRNLLMIGTSLTAGYGLDPAQAWTTRLQRKIDSAGLGFHVVNAGVSGETSADALRRMDWLLSQGIPAMIVLETGANDALRGQAVDSIRANLDAILSHLDTLQPRPVIVVAGMEALPNLGRRYGGQFSAIFPGAARQHHAYYLPFLLDGVAGVDSLNQADGIHPNAAGSYRVANNVWRTLFPILDSLRRAVHGGL
jgi:acyl-CoA thioesterase-1